MIPKDTIKITILKDKYKREEWDEKGLLIGNKEYEIKYLAKVMEHLAQKSEPDNWEILLQTLRDSYRQLNVRSFSFSKNNRIIGANNE